MRSYDSSAQEGSVYEGRAEAQRERCCQMKEEVAHEEDFAQEVAAKGDQEVASGIIYCVLTCKAKLELHIHAVGKVTTP